MRAAISIEIERDFRKARKFQIVMRQEGEHPAILAADLTQHDAWRMLIPLRKAFLAGVQWLRNDSVSYLMSAHPRVICEGHSEP